MSSQQSTVQAAGPRERVCAYMRCRKAGIDLNLCNQCKGIYYCSKECQKADWRIHKLICKQFAETPRPQSLSGEEYHRIILFDPTKTRPEIMWVDSSKEWVTELYYPGVDFATATGREMHSAQHPNTFFIKPIVPEGSSHGYSHDHHIEFICRYPKYVNNGVNEPRFTRNENIMSAMEQSNLHIHFEYPNFPGVLSRWSGKDRWSEVLIEGGPKLQDITMADFSRSMHWLALRDGSFGGNQQLSEEEKKLQYFHFVRLTPSARLHLLRECGYDIREFWDHLEETRQHLLRVAAGEEPETVDLGGGQILQVRPFQRFVW